MKRPTTPETTTIKIGKKEYTATVLSEPDENGMIQVQIPSGSTMRVERLDPVESTTKKETTKTTGEESSK